MQELVTAPFLPAHDQAAKRGAKIVEVTLEVVEKEMKIAQAFSSRRWASMARFRDRSSLSTKAITPN